MVKESQLQSAASTGRSPAADLVLVVPASHNFEADLPPAQYALLAQRRVQKQFEFDIVVVKDGSENLEQAVAFFQQVRERPGMKKGLLRIAL